MQQEWNTLITKRKHKMQNVCTSVAKMMMTSVFSTTTTSLSNSVERCLLIPQSLTYPVLQPQDEAGTSRAGLEA